jgi:CheY-like chemotaxis protein
MANNKYILCIDDDDDDCSLLREAIIKANTSFSVKSVKSGDEAIKFLVKGIEKNDLPGLIVLDINMPGMDGQEALVRIQKLLALSYIPILFLSTNPSENDMLLAESRNVSVFTKPTSMKGYDDITQTIFKTLLKDY